jgi:hypothetical protein
MEKAAISIEIAADLFLISFVSALAVQYKNYEVYVNYI